LKCICNSDGSKQSSYCGVPKVQNPVKIERHFQNLYPRYAVRTLISGGWDVEICAEEPSYARYMHSGSGGGGHGPPIVLSRLLMRIDGAGDVITGVGAQGLRQI